MVVLNEANVLNVDSLVKDARTGTLLPWQVQGGHWASPEPLIRWFDKRIKQWIGGLSLSQLNNYFSIRTFDSIEEINSYLTPKHINSNIYIILQDYVEIIPKIKKYPINVITGMQPIFYTLTDHLAEYFQQNGLANIEQLSFEDAIRLSEEWIIKLNSRSSTEEGKIKTIYEFEDGYKIVELIDQQAYNREGKLMGHCVAGYLENQQDSIILSLRDEENNPHVTMEVKKEINKNRKDKNGNFIEEKMVKQIKGKQNQPPVEKYRKYILDFLWENRDSYFVPINVQDAVPLGFKMAETTKGWHDAFTFKHPYYTNPPKE